MKKIIEKRKDIVFFVKLYPLPMHKEAYPKSKSIDCAGTLKSLDDAMEGKKLPPAKCDSTEVDDNIKLAEQLDINGTPNIIMQDNTVIPGYMEADDLITAITGGKKTK